MTTTTRSRWAAIGAVIAICLGAGGIGLVDAAKGSGERSVYTAIEPCRLLDTRPNQGIGGRTAPLGPGEIYPLTAHGDNGQCTGIPADTLALELNVTGLQNTGATHFTVWDGQGDVPNASHVNLAPGASATPNSVTTELDGARFAIFNNSATSHVIVDIVGIYQDHTHDDRYYTESEVDAAIQNQKFVNINTMKDAGGREANVPIGGPLRFDASLVVPPDYTGGDLTLVLNVMKLDFSPQVSCTVTLTSNYLYVMRPSTGASVTPAELTGSGTVSLDAVFRDIDT
jgi:hypothetical protein